MKYKFIRKLFIYRGKVKMTEFCVLTAAACLEVGGDALVRWGLKAGRILGFVLGAVVLFSYGFVVNQPKWDFSQLLGIYIVLFFFVSQITGYFIFHEAVTQGRLFGGLLILAGGICMMVWN
jgi:multidrug transporter EmrE-like cation transporter